MKARYLVFFLWLILPLPAFAQDTFTILFLGDSLTEGYGLEEGESFPDMLSDRYAAEGRKNLKIINAGISGSTSASALTRLQWYIRAQPDLLVLSLGANDGLRGLSVDALKANLIKTIEFAQSMDVKVVLTGMLIPPNYGPDYTSAFAQVFPDLAAQYQLTFLPFLLAGVAGITELNQGDGIHPNLEGTKIVADTLYNFLQPLLP
ncbi:MAG: arylesterase [Pseudohongiellaceae bacterium]